MAWLCERAKVVACTGGDPEFLRHAPEAVGVVVRTATQVNSTLLDLLPTIKVIGRAGVGVDNIDLVECARRKITVVHTPDANTQSVVEYLFSLILARIRPPAFIAGPMSSAQWNAAREAVVVKAQLNELTLGILGLGRIGSRVAEVAHAFGMRTLFNDIRDIPQEARSHAMPVDAATLFRQSDIITVHIDGRPSNAKFVSASLLSTMRSGALFINASRGFVVDAAALADFLKAHSGAHAILDVHDPEPVDAHNPLLGLPNADLAAHLASRTATAITNMSWVVKDVLAVALGDAPRYPVSTR